ncbi:unnamed protein product [Dibothriocephalus latus]|uniref:Uncharacterized protein n=1 Tax=Dibothriocephalus latus TaxID=60516 RepID=A0A3P7RM05_DIBLA|nr:unnamed protein product [Dibothriocephalus latus]
MGWRVRIRTHLCELCSRFGQRLAFSLPLFQARWRCLPRSLCHHAGGHGPPGLLHGICLWTICQPRANFYLEHKSTF